MVVVVEFSKKKYNTAGRFFAIFFLVYTLRKVCMSVPEKKNLERRAKFLF